MGSLEQSSIVHVGTIFFFFFRLGQACHFYSHSVSFTASCVHPGKVKFRLRISVPT